MEEGGEIPGLAEMPAEAKRGWREALASGDLKYPVKEAQARARGGAKAIVLDADVFEGAGEKSIPAVMAAISARVKAPLVLEGGSEGLIEKAGRYYSGKALRADALGRI